MQLQRGRHRLAGRKPCQRSGGWSSGFYRVVSIKRRSVDAEFAVECVTQVEFTSPSTSFFPYLL